ncbi:hypothetical protein C2G38_2165401 [Gigaspora rosea]|uniref:Uncharacterized protein n=1 Tax=Gigaspora rosea TaxID=44941 RepID=A0A397VV80_9GLOM|nr:hypothetical protein C2G38_2165401 [Gigaspora rosea]
MLRISDRLWELFLSDLQRGHLMLNENIQNLILTEIKRLQINHFHFWIERSTQNSSYTSLMGSDKLNILENFSFTSFISKEFSQKRANQLCQLWTSFFELYKIMTLANIAGSKFKIKAESWLKLFLTPSKGQPNRSNFICGMYRIICHVHELINIHQEFEIAAFDCSAIEKKNHLQVCLCFQSTLKDGGHENYRRSYILEILEHKNRELFFQLSEVPNYFKKSKSYRLEN